MKILIIRHGAPDYANDSLTEKGVREAALLALRLQKLPIRALYGSPLGRARRTMQPTAEALNLTPTILPWLTEFPGKMQNPDTEKPGIPWNQRPQFWTNQPEWYGYEAWKTHPLMRAGDAPEVYDRVTAGFDALLSEYGYRREGLLYRCERNTDDTIALFAHFGVGMVLLSHVSGIAPTLLWQSLFLPTSSVTTLITEEREPGCVFFKCMQVGDTSHLYAGDEPVSNSGLFAECYDGDKERGPRV